MKKIFILASLLISVAVSANSVKVSSDYENPGLAELSDVPAKTIQLLLEQGAKFTQGPNNTQTISVSNIHCDYHSNAALDGVLSGIPTSSCRITSVEGSEVKNSVALLETIIKIENASQDVYFSDCSMGGNCVTDVKDITCTVDLDIETFSKGRFSCVFTSVE